MVVKPQSCVFLPVSPIRTLREDVTDDDQWQLHRMDPLRLPREEALLVAGEHPATPGKIFIFSNHHLCPSIP